MSEGSHWENGTACAEAAISPTFGTPFGLSACAEIRPRDRRDDRLERNAGDGRVPDLAAAERETEGADRGVRDVASRREPVEQVLRVLHLSRPVEPELAAGGAGPAGVAGERGEPELRQRAAVRLHVGVGLPETVEEDDAGPAAGRRGAARDDVRAREWRRVRGV